MRVRIYQGIFATRKLYGMCTSGDGSSLMVLLVTKKALPPKHIVHSLTLEERSWEDGGVKVTNVVIPIAIQACQFKVAE